MQSLQGSSFDAFFCGCRACGVSAWMHFLEMGSLRGSSFDAFFCAFAHGAASSIYLLMVRSLWGSRFDTFFAMRTLQESGFDSYFEYAEPLGE